MLKCGNFDLVFSHRTLKSFRRLTVLLVIAYWSSSISFLDKEASDEMSQFYKDFLDQHYELHTKYNRYLDKVKCKIL